MAPVRSSSCRRDASTNVSPGGWPSIGLLDLLVYPTRQCIGFVDAFIVAALRPTRPRAVADVATESMHRDKAGGLWPVA